MTNTGIGRVQRQCGSALLVAILIAAIVSLLSVRFAAAFMLQVDQAGLRQQTRLADTYVTGAEQLAAQLLMLDAASGNIDHGTENWAQQIPPLPTDHGWLQVELRDAQALFNLNNLSIKTQYSDDAGAPVAVRFSPAQKQFIRLLQSFDDYPVSEQDAILMTEALIDWIDADDTASGQGGAESLYYSSGNLASQAANQLLSDLSELYLVRHYSPAIIDRLRPWVVVLPQPAAMNLNTAPAALLATINQPDSLQSTDDPALLALTDIRRQQAFAATEDFFRHALMQSLVPDAETNSGQADVPLFSVGSHWFQLYTTVSVNGKNSRWLSLIARDGPIAYVRSRKKLY